MLRHMRLVGILTLVGVALGLLGGCQGPRASATGHVPAKKIKVTKLDELPQHTYPIAGTVSELIHAPDQVAGLAAAVRANIESDLLTYEIDDDSTMQRMYSTLLSIELIEGRDEAAMQRIRMIRLLESKQAKKLTNGLATEAMILARREVERQRSPDLYVPTFRRLLGQRLAALPWDVVQDVIEQNKGRLEIFSRNFIFGIVQSNMDPVVAETGELNADLAASVLGMYVVLTQRLQLKNETIAAYQEVINRNRTVKPDIWAARAVTLNAAANHTPVLVGVWDSGTDPAVFADQLWVNNAEQANGQDDDGNGYIDDINGIAYDIHAQRTTGMLFPLGDAAGRIGQCMQHLKGLTDLQAAIDSPEASALKQHLGSLDPQQVQGFIEDLGLTGNYAHGTHVGGIMLAGNPFARMLIARLSYDHHLKPVARTVEWGRRDAAKCRDTVAYFKEHGVRVVNMSWGEKQADAEESLEKNGIGNNAEDRRAMARKVFTLQKEGLYEAISGAPDILFVCAAGNSDADVEFDEDIPSSFVLPNMITVGAVDQAGDPTTFTSFGSMVQVYASGFEVESYVPGGQIMKMSGTSMASPNVANLAAKILAVKPELTPPQVIDLIKRGADSRTYGEQTILLINPQRTMGLLD